MVAGVGAGLQDTTTAEAAALVVVAIQEVAAAGLQRQCQQGLGLVDTLRLGAVVSTVGAARVGRASRARTAIPARAPLHRDTRRTLLAWRRSMGGVVPPGLTTTTPR